ncbi:MAG: glycoside hydrolase TIM-barrel-like domain-containing protein, partial [Pseudomonadota bacterium]
DSAPAFRGTAYVVFERLPLSDFGNRLPQLSFEVFRSVDRFSEQVRGVVMIPGSGEFVYATTPVTRSGPDAEQLGDNVHTARAETDFLASLDDLQSALPGVRSVSLVVSWFGSDLRAGHCTLQPGIDWSQKTTDPLVWSVAGRNRANAYEVSQTEGRANYGGTPSDQSVIEAIRELKARGIAVTLNPFILMDVPPDATLPDPYTPGAFQAPFPWRGRITVDPAPGEVNSPDQSTVAAGQVAAFTGTAAAAHFGLSGETVTYAGPDEWSYRRMILHYAHLAKAAGGVDAFLIGSEMRGLTHVRDGATSYPFVRDLIALATDVRAVLGPDTKITYAADWSEYFGHQPN